MSIVRSGGIAGIFERVVGGRAAEVGPALQGLDQFGQKQYDSGTALGDEGIAGVRGLVAGYKKRLNGGSVLPTNVNRAYDLARGRVNDGVARGNMAAAAAINQRALSSGGFLSPEAREELYGAHSRSNDAAAFDATANIDTSQAGAELSQTNNLNDRVDGLTSTILNAGQFRQQLGAQVRAQSVLARLDRNKAIANTIMRGFGK